MNNKVIMGEMEPAWRMGEVVTVTLCVTEACNLACTYCYMLHKNNQKEMSLETGKKIIDYILSDEMPISDNSIVLEFIGGEPTIRMDLISEICDYFVTQLYIKNHKWLSNYRFNFSSNGLLYSSKKVQEFLSRHRGHISFAISLDGTKEKHDMSRIKPDGSGSYDDVILNAKLWIKQFNGRSTKSTFAHDDICYLKDSVIHLWNLGIHNVMANIVFEDVWKPGDEVIFENQLNQLADYIVDNDLWYTHNVRFFSPQLGLPSDISISMCGAGRKMLTFDPDGNMYPCTRFLDFCLDNSFNSLGSINTGINKDRLRPFFNAQLSNCMDDECSTCLISNGCYHCLGNNYYYSQSIFSRKKYGCEMHKANVRANNRLWYLYSKQKKCTSPITESKVALPNDNILKYLYIITDDDIAPMCSYSNKLDNHTKMTPQMLSKCIDYCFKNHLAPVFIGNADHGLTDESTFFTISSEDEITRKHATLYTEDKDYIANNIIITINKSNISFLHSKLKNVKNENARINIFINDLISWTEEDYKAYYLQLSEILIEIRNKNLSIKIENINLFKTIVSSAKRCGAGRNSIAVAPDGNMYLCPAFYFENKHNTTIGNILDDFEFNPIRILNDDKLPICKGCSTRCNVCIYENFSSTGEINIPSFEQCKIQSMYKRLIDRASD